MREARDMSQEALGAHLGVTRACVSQWEKGITAPKMGKLEKMAGVFGVPVSTIIDGYGPKDLTAAERQLLEAFRSLDDETRKTALMAVVAMAGGKR